MSIVGTDALLSVATKLSERSRVNDCGSGPRPLSHEMVRSSGPSPFRLLLIGGGAAVGYGVLSHDLALAGHLARGVTEVTGYGIDMDVMAEVDLRCRDLSALTADVDLERYDMVLVSLGAQDVVDFLPPATFSEAVENLLDGIRAGVGRAVPVGVIAVPKVSNVLHLDPLLARAVDHRAEEFNGLLAALCASRPDFTVLPFAQDGDAVPCSERDSTTYHRWAEPMIAPIARSLDTVYDRARPSLREEARQSALDRLALLDTPPEETFDNVTRTARRIFRTLGAAISLIDGDRQWFKSTDGMVVPDLPRRDSLCAFTIQTNHGFFVEDATLDPRLADSYFVVAAGLRSYAGVPIRDPSGYMVGTLCVFDDKPRQFTDSEIATLRSLAHLIEKQLLVVTR